MCDKQNNAVIPLHETVIYTDVPLDIVTQLASQNINIHNSDGCTALHTKDGSWCLYLYSRELM